MFLHTGDGRTQAFLMLMLAAGVLYASARVAVFALARPDGLDPGRRAIGQWLPIAGTAIISVCMNRPEIALSLILSSSVGFLSLGVGMIAWLHPLQTLPPSRKAWPFVFSAALLVLIAGFSSHLAWWHGLMLFGLGGAVYALWTETSDAEVATSDDQQKPREGQSLGVLVLAVVLIVLGGCLAVYGTLATTAARETNNRLLSPGTLAATILSPMLILPSLGGVSTVAQRGHPGRAISAVMGTILLNLCLLLPIVIILWHLRPGDWNLQITKAFGVRWDRGHNLPFDIAAWQIEAVGLVILGFAMIPVAIGKWMIGRFEATLLILSYAAYIVVLAVFGLQLG